MGFPRQEYWSRLPFHSPGDLADPGIEPMSPALPGGFLPLSQQGSPHCVRNMVEENIAKKGRKESGLRKSNCNFSLDGYGSLQ